MIHLVLALAGFSRGETATGQANQYPRFFSSTAGKNGIVKIEAHFDTDLLVFAGYSHDQALSMKTCYTCEVPVFAAMSIERPVYKWAKTMSGHLWALGIDVFISRDGKRVVAASQSYDYTNPAHIIVLEATSGFQIASIVHSGSR